MPNDSRTVWNARLLNDAKPYQTVEVQEHDGTRREMVTAPGVMVLSGTLGMVIPTYHMNPPWLFVPMECEPTGSA